MKLKPVPKFILIVAIVAAIGYAGNIGLEKRKANLAAAASQAPEVATVTEAPAQTEATPRNIAPMDSDSAPAANAGLAKLLQSKKQ